MPGDGKAPFEKIRHVTESDAFESIIATLLVLNAGALVVESFVDVGAWDEWLWIFFVGSQVVFLAEIALRILGYGPRFQAFFREGWNVFDFVVVVLSFVPMVGPFSFVARIVRVLRVLRVVVLYIRRSRRGAP